MTEAQDANGSNNGTAPTAKKRSRFGGKAKDDEVKEHFGEDLVAPVKKKSRFGASAKNIPKHLQQLQLPVNMTPEQKEFHVLKVQIDDITRRVIRGDVLPPPDRERSPSPEPIYGRNGERVNTRERRYKDKLLDERQAFVDRALVLDPSYKPPLDLRMQPVSGGKPRDPNKIVNKVPIPHREHPGVNFIGLVIGPRGRTQKKLEADTGAKISIRGNGSVKEGKMRRDGRPQDSLEEDLHVLITGDTQDIVDKATAAVEKLLIVMPDEDNEHKQEQLRELARLNGTLREDTETCRNCGQLGHIARDCQAPISDPNACQLCGTVGHKAANCPNNASAKDMDSTFSDFMAGFGDIKGDGDAGGRANDAPPHPTGGAPPNPTAPIRMAPIKMVPNSAPPPPGASSGPEHQAPPPPTGPRPPVVRMQPIRMAPQAFPGGGGGPPPPGPGYGQYGGAPPPAYGHPAPPMYPPPHHYPGQPHNHNAVPPPPPPGPDPYHTGAPPPPPPPRNDEDAPPPPPPPVSGAAPPPPPPQDMESSFNDFMAGL